MTLFILSIILIFVVLVLAKSRERRGAAVLVFLFGVCSIIYWYQLSHKGGDANVDTGTVSRLINRDKSPMQGLAWSPDGKRLATYSDRGDLFVWCIQDKADGQSLYVLFQDSRVKSNFYVIGNDGRFPDDPASIAWLNNGKQLASLSTLNGLDVADVPESDSGRTTTAYEDKQLRGKGLTACYGSNSLVWANGKTVVSFDMDKKSTTSFEGNQEGEINTIACQPLGSLILTAGSNGTWALWDFSSHSKVKEDKGHTQSISACCWSPDGKTFATGSEDSSIKVWTASGEISKVIGEGEKKEAVTGLSWSPDGKFLASCHSDKTVYIWDTATGQRFTRGIGFGDSKPYSIAWKPNSKSVAVGTEGVVWLWDLP